jgi:hypothetical protein
MMLTIIIEVIGWAAALLILAAYALLTAGKLKADDRAYQWMNVLGAAGFIINSGWNGAIPSAALNVIWMGIGAVALVRIAGRKGQSRA